jgi:Cys-rich protein (TIGR04453 family)
MIFRNWILIVFVLFSVSLVTVKRLYTSKKVVSISSINNDVCHELCSSLESCSQQNSDLRLVNHAKEIGKACLVLCQKNHPNFQNCSPKLKCEPLTQCILTGSANDLK